MVAPVEFKPYDATFLYSVGQSVTFDTAWHAYCLNDRLCFQHEANAPAFASHRQEFAAAIQRGVSAGLVIIVGDLISLADELESQFAARRESGLIEYEAFEDVDAFLQSRTWDVVSTAQLST